MNSAQSMNSEEQINTTKKRVRFQVKDTKDYAETAMIPKVVESIEFRTMSSSDIMKLSEIEIVSTELYDRMTLNPTAYGLLDPRLGVSGKRDICLTCNKDIYE